MSFCLGKTYSVLLSCDSILSGKTSRVCASACVEKALAASQAKTPPVVLAVNAQGQYYVGTTLVKEADLLPTLKALAEKDAQTTILIRADKNIPYAKVAQLLLASQGAGLEKVSIDTQATGQ